MTSITGVDEHVPLQKHIPDVAGLALVPPSSPHPQTTIKRSFSSLLPPTTFDCHIHTACAPTYCRLKHLRARPHVRASLPADLPTSSPPLSRPTPTRRPTPYPPLSLPLLLSPGNRTNQLPALCDSHVPSTQVIHPYTSTQLIYPCSRHSTHLPMLRN